APEQARGARVDPVFEHCVSVAASVSARLHDLGYETELFETNEFLDGEDDPRLGGIRVASEESMSALMRHLMHTQPNERGDGPARPSTVGDVVHRALRVGRAPLVYIHRELGGDDLAAIRDLAAVGTPAIAVIVGDHSGASTPRGRDVAEVQRDFAKAGWETVVMSTAHADPWKNAVRGDAGSTTGARR
ncbi:MAG: hypothetical protein ACTH31_16570, partial [Pseudoclavibacter sp.]